MIFNIFSRYSVLFRLPFTGSRVARKKMSNLIAEFKRDFFKRGDLLLECTETFTDVPRTNFNN